tara:strand:- start:36 stop:1178 length:1143 start_codon:yes stop_codon:yes gene_type:complete
MSKTKSIYDPLHGFITITPLMQQIIDTPEFQRLRDIKQLGATYYVFPSATHTRFEHSIGVSYLAGLMTQTLQKNQPDIDITDRFIELVRIAGLVHDIGHGPFSHLYDHYIIDAGEDEHEERGKKIFQDIVIKYDIELAPEETELIIDMVHPNDRQIYNWKYQIVANSRSQIDVDKLDYIQRDCYHLGMKFGGEYSRLIHEVRICDTEDGTQELAWPEKLQFEIFAMFTTRYRLHKQVYHHHTVKAYEYLIINILKRIKDSIKPDFLLLTDSIVTCRYHSSSLDIQNRIATRNIPKLIEENVYLTIDKTIAPGIKYDIKNKTIKDTVRIGFTSGSGENPLNSVLYYSKRDSPIVAHAQHSHKNSFMIPLHHQELLVRIYTI